MHQPFCKHGLWIQEALAAGVQQVFQAGEGVPIGAEEKKLYLPRFATLAAALHDPVLLEVVRAEVDAMKAFHNQAVSTILLTKWQTKPGKVSCCACF